MTKLVPKSIASCVRRHMRFKSDGRRTSGTGTFPKRFINQPYAGILKCDSSSHPRTNCGMAQYNMNGSKRFTRSEEHTSELQSHSNISYDVFCLKKKKHVADAHVNEDLATQHAGTRKKDSV